MAFCAGDDVSPNKKNFAMSDKLSPLSRYRSPIALVAFCFLLTLTFWMAKQRNSEIATFKPIAMPKKIDIHNADRLTIHRPGSAAIALQKSGEQWKLFEPITGD